MSLPRNVGPDRFYLITRRCAQRQFFLRPDDETNNAFLYCLAVAAQRSRIDVLLPVAMSNHHHTTIYDRLGTYPAFIEYFHKLFARCQNAHRGRWENFWATEQPSVVRLVDAEDVMRKLVYAATNPVKAHLVAHTYQWPGVNGLDALLTKRELTIHRPKHFFRANGPMPETVTLRFQIPAVLGDEDLFLATLKQRVEAEEARIEDERLRAGARVIGARLVRQQSWRGTPATHEPRRVLSPRVAAANRWAREEALLRNREFIAAYRFARARWILGEAAVFPEGTYWLRRFANVPIAAS